VESIVAVLWYRVFATNNARSVLGGNPFDNRLRWYHGSSNDWRLNLRIRRFSAAPAAVSAMRAYETTGRLQRPLQTTHTLYNPVVPFWHHPIYRVKTLAAGAGTLHLGFPSGQYGHCAVTREEALAGFALLVLRVTERDLLTSATVFQDQREREAFLRLSAEQVAYPRIQ
jgi:hypothetical protein